MIVDGNGPDRGAGGKTKRGAPDTASLADDELLAEQVLSLFGLGFGVGRGPDVLGESEVGERATGGGGRSSAPCLVGSVVALPIRRGRNGPAGGTEAVGFDLRGVGSEPFGRQFPRGNGIDLFEIRSAFGFVADREEASGGGRAEVGWGFDPNAAPGDGLTGDGFDGSLYAAGEPGWGLEAFLRGCAAGEEGECEGCQESAEAAGRAGITATGAMEFGIEKRRGNVDGIEPIEPAGGGSGCGVGGVFFRRFQRRDPCDRF